MSTGVYRVEFWDTARGTLAKRQDVKVREGTLALAVPPFSKDIAFKAWKR
jgi:hypothetical protein